MQMNNPYQITRYPKDTTIQQLKDAFVEEKAVSTAGRLITKREHGKSCFADIEDISGKIQVYAHKEKLLERFAAFQSLKVGDIIGVAGKLFKTKTGESTVFLDDFSLLAPAALIIPEKWHGLKDVEVRYRQRYLDLIANKASREIFVKRCRIIDEVRDFFKKREYMEVETPMLHPIPGGAAGRPFKTHHHTLDMDIYLRIAPELYLKRLLVGGFERIFEMNRSFRNEGISTRHNPEFTMLEAYCSYQDYQYMMDLTEALFRAIAQALYQADTVTYQGRALNLSGQWQRVSFARLMKEECNVDPSDAPEEAFDKMCKKLNLSLKNLSRTQVLKITEELIEKKFPSDRPVFVVDFFKWMSPLSKSKKDAPELVERFELFAGGMEIANAYSELNDPEEQERRFLEQLKLDEETSVAGRIDTDFVQSLKYGMPPAAGLGIGIDRLVMLFLDQPSIREVILFPLSRTLADA